MSLFTHLPLTQRYSLYLATVEVVLGAFLHSARIPLTGYILSLHQAFCLGRAVQQEGRTRLLPLHISATVAVLKTLSPTGKRLTPMMAIITQGALFNVGILCLGNTLGGQLLGAILLSFWGFIQPVLLSYAIFGQDLIAGLNTLNTLISQYIPVLSLPLLLVLIISLKAILAMGAVLLAKSSLTIEPWIEKQLENHLNTIHQKNKKNSLIKSILKELGSFWFLFSFSTILIFSWWRQDPIAQMFLILTGYLAQAILFFMILRLINVQKVILYLEEKGFYRLSSNLRTLFTTLWKSP